MATGYQPEVLITDFGLEDFISLVKLPSVIMVAWLLLMVYWQDLTAMLQQLFYSDRTAGIIRLSHLMRLARVLRQLTKQDCTQDLRSHLQANGRSSSIMICGIIHGFASILTHHQMAANILEG